MTDRIQNNIVHLLDEAAQRNPNRKALVSRHDAVTFGELLSSVQQCANLLISHGLHRGDRVIIMVPMSIDLYVVLLAVIRCGAVAVFVDPWIPMKQIAAFSAFASPSGFIGIPKSHLLRLLKPTLAGIRISVSTGKTMCGIPARISLQECNRHPAEGSPAAVDPDDPALITFTSGSSGIPKGANRTHAFLRSQYDALCRELDYRDDDIDMPMFPVFALRNLAAGITSVIPDMDFRNVAAVDADVIRQQISKNNVTLITASPPLVDRIASLPEPPVLRKIFTGGAPVNDRQIETWQRFFPSTSIDIIYGSTEAEPVAHLSGEEWLKTAGMDGFCCGRPTDLLKTRIVRIRKGAIAPSELESLTLPRGETGELLVAGNHVCRDYFNNPEALKENKIIEPDGTCWHRMGDTGYFDENGRFFLTGRVHSTICRNGTLLHAQLVEAAISEIVPSASRVAALERDGKLVVVLEGIRELPSVPIDADRILCTRTALPLDPRHKSKIDYTELNRWIDLGKIK